jgi:hypothetical protein
MGEDPSIIRAELEQTRQRVGDEIDALSYRTDVKARAGDYVEDKKTSVKSKLTSAKEAVMGVGGSMGETMGSVGSAAETARGRAGSTLETVGTAVPDRAAVARSARGLRATAERNPVGLAIGGLALGFVVGTLLPSTRLENEQLGETSDRLLGAARDAAEDAVDRAKQVAHDAADAAKDAVGETVETTKDSAREQGRELTSSLQERASGQS